MILLKYFKTMIIILFTMNIAFAQKVNQFPKLSDPLHVKIALNDALMRGNHWNEGTVMQHVIFPPAGIDRPVVGNQEDSAEYTAELLAAYSFRYAVTKDPQVRQWANELMEGLLKLEKVTGVPGLVARSFYRTSKPLWHEQAYFFPLEWHQSTSMSAYRWEGDLSSDKFTLFIYGVSIYWELCADETHKQLAAGFIDRFIGRCVDCNFKIVDLDNKMTLWGNFCPDLPHQPLNSLEMLAALKSAYHLTSKDRYRSAYEMLINKYHYDDQALKAKILWPEKWVTPGDDDLAARSLYILLRWETDNSLLIKYRMALNRHWYYWKNSNFQRDIDVYFTMLYQVLTDEKVVDDKCINAAKNMKGVLRTKGVFFIPTDHGTKKIESEQEFHATGMIHNYWFGRYYGFIDKNL